MTDSSINQQTLILEAVKGLDKKNAITKAQLAEKAGLHHDRISSRMTRLARAGLLAREQRILDGRKTFFYWCPKANKTSSKSAVVKTKTKKTSSVFNAISNLIDTKEPVHFDKITPEQINEIVNQALQLKNTYQILEAQYNSLISNINNTKNLIKHSANRLEREKQEYKQLKHDLKKIEKQSLKNAMFLDKEKERLAKSMVNAADASSKLSFIRKLLERSVFQDSPLLHSIEADYVYALGFNRSRGA